jgi:hypothetical protein
MLLGAVDRQRGVSERFAECFVDGRDRSRVEHSVVDLVRQRTYALALGYEDLNDHDELRSDPLLAAVVGKTDPTGAERARQRDQGRALAGKSTLHRLERAALGPAPGDASRPLSLKAEAVDGVFVDLFVGAHPEPPSAIVLDFDTTDLPLHGTQQGRFFHGYYGHYCYLPLYVFCGDHLLLARLRPADQDAAAGAVEELESLVGAIRQRWPEVAITVRADSGFAREELMAWCEAHQVDYVIGLARNRRLEQMLEPAFERVEALCADSGQPERIYEELRYQTRQSWSCERRVIGKAEITHRGENPRFIVTSLAAQAVDARTLYETIFCARGEMENRIKEQQLDLFAGRVSAHEMAVNQLRLWLASLAYVLLSELRRLGLAGTASARLRCQSIRLKLLKIGARVQVSRRRIVVALASAYPFQQLFATVFQRLTQDPPLPA